jgi:hypothetical protein
MFSLLSNATEGWVIGLVKSLLLICPISILFESNFCVNPDDFARRQSLVARHHDTIHATLTSLTVRSFIQYSHLVQISSETTVSGLLARFLITQLDLSLWKAHWVPNCLTLALIDHWESRMDVREQRPRNEPKTRARRTRSLDQCIHNLLYQLRPLF